MQKRTAELHVLMYRRCLPVLLKSKTGEESERAKTLLAVGPAAPQRDRAIDVR